MYHILFPLILIFYFVGAYSINNRLWDVGVMLVFGIIGYLMKKMDLPLAATVLTFVLGQKMESSLLQSLSLSDGASLAIFFQRPISAGVLIVIILTLLASTYSSYKNKRNMLVSDAEI